MPTVLLWNTLESKDLARAEALADTENHLYEDLSFAEGALFRVTLHLSSNPVDIFWSTSEEVLM
jgi:hypothetical protein